VKSTYVGVLSITEYLMFGQIDELYFCSRSFGKR